MIWNIDKKEFKDISLSSSKQRFEYFVKKVVKHEEIWSLKNNDGWVTFDEEKEKEMIPFWPHPEFSEGFPTEYWNDCSPEKIDIYEFIDIWIPSLIKSGKKIYVFPVLTRKSTIIKPEKMLKSLEDEIESYK